MIKYYIKFLSSLIINANAGIEDPFNTYYFKYKELIKSKNVRSKESKQILEKYYVSEVLKRDNNKYYYDFEIYKQYILYILSLDEEHLEQFISDAKK